MRYLVKCLLSLVVILVWIGFSVPTVLAASQSTLYSSIKDIKHLDCACVSATSNTGTLVIKTASSGREKENCSINVSEYEVEDDEVTSRKQFDGDAASIFLDQTLDYFFHCNRTTPFYNYFSCISSYRYHYLILQVFRI